MQEAKEIQASIFEFANKYIDPYLLEWDNNEIFPEEVVRKIAKELGLFKLFKEDYKSYILAVETLGNIDASIALSVAAQVSLVISHVSKYGSEEIKNKYLEKLLDGTYIGAWCLTEPEAGSDAASIKTSAVSKDSKFVINGHKVFSTHGTVADLYIVMAKTAPELKHAGISAFIVEKGTPGLKPIKMKNKLGMRIIDTAEVFFENVEVPASQLIGKLNHGFYDVLDVLDGGRVSVAAVGIGIAARSIKEALKYAKERKQFGKHIISFEDIQFKLAELYTKLEAARHLVYSAAECVASTKHCSKHSAMAKLAASEIAMEATRYAIQVFGGYGYFNDLFVARAYRDAKLLEIGEGTSEIQKLVIAKQMIKEGIPF